MLSPSSHRTHHSSMACDFSPAVVGLLPSNMNRRQGHTLHSGPSLICTQYLKSRSSVGSDFCMLTITVNWSKSRLALPLHAAPLSMCSSFTTQLAADVPRSIRVYNVFLRGDSSTGHSLVFEATPVELYPMGRIAGMKINGEIMVAVFAPLSMSSEHPGQIICVNLVSRATAVLECSEWVCLAFTPQKDCTHE